MNYSSSTLPALAVAGLALIALPIAPSVAEPTAGPSGALAATAPVKAALTAVPRIAVERFSAVTTAMSPSDVTVRFDLLRWSDDESRAGAVAALGEPDPAAALRKLPTLGHVWLSGSAVGFAVKYADRAPMADGGERITFVTDRSLGSYDFNKWSPAPPLASKDLAYGVIELYLDANGHGTGTFSLAADVQVDAASSRVSLAEGAPRLLTNAKAEPKRYDER